MHLWKDRYCLSSYVNIETLVGVRNVGEFILKYIIIEYCVSPRLKITVFVSYSKESLILILSLLNKFLLYFINFIVDLISIKAKENI